MSSTVSESPVHAPNKLLDAGQQPEPAEEKPPRDMRFWLVFLCLCVCSFIAAVELGAISTALPTIIEALHGTQFIWVGSAFTLGSTALIPFAGGLAQIFGRRPILLGSILLFAVGSAQYKVLVGGGIISLTQIIIADLVSLRERGTFNGIISIAYSIGGGSLAAKGQWRWLFYLNIPICGLAAALVLAFLHLRTPPGTLREKFGRIDYFGNFLVVAATTSTVIGLTWGGIQFSWGSAKVLVPLILGLVGLGLFLLYEGLFAPYPMVPFNVLCTRTGLSGYAQNFLTSMLMITLNYYLQVYFQACYNVSSIGSGVDGMPVAFIAAPIGLIAGIVIQKTNGYRITITVGWILAAVGYGLLSTLDADTSRGKSIGYSVICGAGFGSLILASYFPVLAPLSVRQNAPALALFVFIRNFSLNSFAQFPEGVEIAYSIIPVIRSLEEPLRTQSLKVVWWTTTGFAGLGFLVSLLMRHYPLHTSVDKDWGMEKMEKHEIDDKL
ncbi:major facilitator superfamily domain-containing protein [Mycena olivaceomarginata]|nr:major facilitator superfamily domain-containing protein [Mycena olivaceomarginata]